MSSLSQQRDVGLLFNRTSLPKGVADVWCPASSRPSRSSKKLNAQSAPFYSHRTNIDVATHPTTINSTENNNNNNNNNYTFMFDTKSINCGTRGTSGYNEGHYDTLRNSAIHEKIAATPNRLPTSHKLPTSLQTYQRYQQQLPLKHQHRRQYQVNHHEYPSASLDFQQQRHQAMHHHRYNNNSHHHQFHNYDNHYGLESHVQKVATTYHPASLLSQISPPFTA